MHNEIAIALGATAGLCFGALAVAVRRGLSRGGTVESGSLATALIACVLSATAALPGIAHPGHLWPFFVVGLLTPGASQLFLTAAVQLAGAARPALVMGVAPLLSVMIAVVALGEPPQPVLLIATALIVVGGVAIVGDRRRPAHFRGAGMGFAALCAVLFAARDNLLRWLAHGSHPAPPLAAAAATLLGATVFLLGFVAVRRRDLLGTLPAQARSFLVAGVCLAGGYDALLSAYAHGRVSIVAPLNATGSLWSVILAALTFAQHERISRRTAGAALLIVGGGALISAFG